MWAFGTEVTKKLCSLLSLSFLLLGGVSCYVMSSPIESPIRGGFEVLNSHLSEAPATFKPSDHRGHDQDLNYDTSDLETNLGNVWRQQAFAVLSDWFWGQLVMQTHSSTVYLVQEETRGDGRILRGHLSEKELWDVCLREVTKSTGGGDSRLCFLLHWFLLHWGTHCPSSEGTSFSFSTQAFPRVNFSCPNSYS